MTTLERDIVEETTTTITEDGAHDRFSHYVKHDDIVAATMRGEVVKAICGKEWVADKAPQGYPVCPTCAAIYEGLPQGGDDDDA